MKMCAMLAAVAGLAAVATAQVSDLQVFEGANLRPVNVNPEAGYGSRATPVYSNGRFPGLNLSFLGGVTDCLDEVDFTGGVWDGATGRALSQMNFGIGQFSANSIVDMRFEFYDANAVDAVNGGGVWAGYDNATDMLGGVAPIFTQTFTNFTTGTGIYSWFTQAVAIALPDGVNRFYVRGSILNAGTSDLWTGAGNAALFGHANDLTVGGGVESFALNTFNIPTVPSFTGNTPTRGDGCAAASGTPEHRSWAPALVCRTIAATGGKGLYLILSGEISVPEPAGTIDLGMITDGCAAQNFTLADGETKFYKVTLPGDATDSVQQFFDADTEGSAANVSIAIWNTTDAALEGSDIEDGSGTNGQLTFGIGRRPAIGDGSCYDGRDGELLATNSYIIAVSAGDAAFGPAYAVSGAGTGGAVTLNLCTNAGGTPAAASVPPCLVSDLGDIAALAGDPPAADMDTGWVVWYKFNNCTDVVDDADGGVQGTYVDFDFSTSFVGSDTMAMVFDSTGVKIAESDDEGTGAFSQFSWGDVAPARSATGDGQAFEGQNGALAQGEYYMAVGLFGLVEGGANRFHVRSTSGSSLPAAFVIYSNGLTACTGGGCPVCSADFNQDGGVDGGDIEAFFIAWEAGEACGDTNQDGGVDGGDIEFFFSQWEAGGC
jgi:hypothetical protein